MDAGDNTSIGERHQRTATTAVNCTIQVFTNHGRYLKQVFLKFNTLS